MPGPGAWERDSDAFIDYIIEGDWRNPQGVCRRAGESGLILPGE